MSQEWLTEEKDLQVAALIIDTYSNESEDQPLGLFEMVASNKTEALDLRLANWVVALSEHFSELYGQIQGDYVTRKIVSRCLTSGETVH